MSDVNNIIEKYLEFFYEKQIDLKSEFLIAVSGGLDSMTVLDMSNKCGMKISVAHINYGLRGEENIFEKKLVEQYCENKNIKFHYKDAQINPAENLQNEARKIRYKFFNEIIHHQNLDYIITAHHQNDNHESFLFHSIRGNGISRLKGISEKNDNILRPALRFTKTQLKEYAEKNQLAYSKDSSNNSIKYDRNFIRNEIFEKLGKRFPEYEKGLSNSIKFLAEDYLLLNQLIKDLLKDQIEINDDHTKITPKDSISILVWSHYFRNFGFNHSQIENWIDTKHQSGKYIESEHFKLLYDRGKWILYQKVFNKKKSKIFLLKKNGSVVDPINLKTRINSELIIDNSNPNVESFDASKLHFPLKLRRWKNGDYIQPLGMSGLKKVSDILIDKKIALNDKNNVFVLLSKNDIIWVVGYVISEKFKITKTSKKFFIVENSN